MEKRIKLPTSSKSTVENVKKQDFGRNPSSSKSSSASKEKPAKKISKGMTSEINVKRTLSSIEIQEKPLKKLKNKDLARRNRIRMKKKDDEASSSSESDDDQSLEESLIINDIKTKKRKDNKFEEKTANFQSQAYEGEAHLELTDEETQTSKAEENNNPNRISGAQMIPNVMDQFGLGQSFGEQLFQQQNVLSKVLDSNLSSESPLIKDKSNKNEKLLDGSVVPNFGTTSFIQGKEKNKNDTSTRQGHYSSGDKPLRIVKTEYNEDINNVLFTMDWKKNEQNNIRPAASQITREELLKYDPLLLVYYYEKHLEFAQYPGQRDFDLEKIPH